MGHIKWSALAVDEAMDQVEKDLEPIFAHLDTAYDSAGQALQIPNLPQYISQSIKGLKFEIDRIRREQHLGLAHQGSLLNAISRVRHAVPEDNLKAEKASAKYGRPIPMEVA